MNKPPTFEPLGRIARNASPQRRFPIAVVAFVVLHGVFFAGLLLQGCRPKTPDDSQVQAPTNALPDVNDLWTRLSPATQTNPPVGTTPPATPPSTTNRMQPPSTPEEDPDTSPPPADRDIASLPGTDAPASQEIITNTPIGSSSPPPVGTTPGETEDMARSSEYQIQQNDTLWGIGQKLGVSVADIERANPKVVPTRLQVGTTLIIPPKREAPAAPAEEAYAGTLHKIEKNETLSSISRKYGVSIEAIVKENGLRTTRIFAGKTLKIPTHLEE
jgi:LysM repeat protein